MRVVVIVLSVLVAPVAAKPNESIVVASSDAGFTHALDAALASAGIAVIAVPDAPQPSLADLTGDARGLADREHATATVELLFGEGGATLLAYDRDVDRVLLRSLPYHAPLAEAQAAEAARMARAMLRALRVTPEIDLPPPRATEAAAVRERAVVTPAPIVAPIAHHDVLALDLVAGARFGTAGATAGEHAAIAINWRPDDPGAVLAGNFVPEQRFAGMAFTGTVSDLALAATGRVPLRIGPRWVIAGEAGAALHRIRVAGTIVGQGAIDITRYDPALRAGATALFELRPGVGIGLAVSVDGLLRRQDYSVDAAQVLAVPVVQLTTGLALVAALL